MRAREAGGRDAVVLHGVFAVIAMAVVAAPLGSLGVRVTFLVALYHLAVVGVARALGHGAWLRVWALTASLSVLQILPDGFLGAALGVLTYGDLGVPKVFGVSVFMAGMWTLPLFPTVLVALHIEARRGLRLAVVAAAFLSLALLGGAEAPAWALDLWRAHGVALIGHTALYVLPAEMVLGVATFLAARAVLRAPSPGLVTVVYAITVMLIFTGTASITYLLIEQARLLHRA